LRYIRIAALGLASMIGLSSAAFLLDVLGIVCFRYPRVVENQPLAHPLRVVSVSGDHLLLADGRDINVVDVYVNPELGLAAAVTHHSRGEIELVTRDGMYDLFIKMPATICGNPYAALFSVPLIPDRLPRFRRLMIGRAVVLQKDQRVKSRVD